MKRYTILDIKIASISFDSSFIMLKIQYTNLLYYCTNSKIGEIPLKSTDNLRSFTILSNHPQIEQITKCYIYYQINRPLGQYRHVSNKGIAPELIDYVIKNLAFYTDWLNSV